MGKGRIVTLPADPVLRLSEIGHWAAEGYRVVEPRPGSRFVALFEPLTSEAADLALTSLPRRGLARLEERLGPEPALPPYDWAGDDG